MSVGKSVSGIIRNRFISGLLVTVPLIISYQVLSFLFTRLDGLLNPFFTKYLGYEIPGLGIVVTVLIVLLVGILAHSVLGRRVFGVWEQFLTKIPIVRTVYSPAKQLLETFTLKSVSSFKRVALIEYPRKGVWVIGFLANEVDLTKGDIKGEFGAVFVPSTPTPFTGYMAMIPKEDIRQLDVPLEEAIKFLVSGGVSCPAQWIAGQEIGKNEAV